MKKTVYILIFSLLVSLTNSCDTTELDLLENPLNVTQEQLDPQLLFNQIQLSFNGFVSGTSNIGSFAGQLTRQGSAMVGSSVYQSAFAPINFNGLWSAAYAGLLQDIQALENFDGIEDFSYHLGVSRIMRAYIYFTLVDLFGDVPFEQALQGEIIENPEFQDQRDVYAAAFAELDLAIANLSTPSAIEPLNDFYYGVSGTSQDSWITAANTLRLRSLNNIRLAGGEVGINVAQEITELLNEGNLIDDITEDWQFNYGTDRVNPNTRHPSYNAFYENNPPGGLYLSNFLMWELATEKGFEDPRLRYYFYRQDNDATDENIFTLGCAVQNAPGHYASFTSIYDNTIGVPFCTAVPALGYWGRDHGDDGGIPPDQNQRTVPGVYPAGGLFDGNQDDDVQNLGTDGLLGEGIQPILLSSYTALIKAEIAEVLGIGNAAFELENGIRESMMKTLTFGNLDPNIILVPDDPETDDGDPTTDDDDETVIFADFFPTTAILNNLDGGLDQNGNPIVFPDLVEDYITFVIDQYTNAGNPDDRLDIIMKEFHIATFGTSLEMYNAYRRTGFPSNMHPSRNANPGDFYRSAFYPANSVNNNTNANQADISRQVFWDTNPPGFIN